TPSPTPAPTGTQNFSSPGSVNLSSSFNRNGIVADGSTFSGGFDGGGNSLSANLLGLNKSWNGTTFDIATSGNDVVVASGQAVSLKNGNYSHLRFLAAAAGGNQGSQQFTVRYTDG